MRRSDDPSAASERARGRRGALAVPLLLLALAGCETARRVGGDVAYELNPFGSTELRVQAVEVHGPYLLAEIAGRREELRIVTPASGACASVLRPEAELRYAKSGSFGRLLGGDTHCDITGIASLAEWRDRQPRAAARGGIVPRSTARFALLFQDAQLILLRGRFALASRVGVPNTYDIVALLPNDAACRAAAASGETSLEFRPAGSVPYRLLAGDTSCEVTGFAMPPPVTAPRAE